MKKYIFSTLLLALFTVGCSEGEAEETKAKDERKEVVKNCMYSYNPAKTQLTWTAFKFLRKAGVGGAFMKIDVKGGDANPSARDLIESLSFAIPINSIETNDQSRNKKIQEFFFGNLATPELISGKVVRLEEGDIAVLEIKMNDITKNVEGKYTLEDNVFLYTTEINVLDWNAEQGLKSLNKECKDLHTDVENGDTESKLWPDVSISFKTTLDKSCD